MDGLTDLLGCEVGLREGTLEIDGCSDRITDGIFERLGSKLGNSEVTLETDG